MKSGQRKRRSKSRAALLALLEEARRDDGPSAPKKHHLVPDSYLTRWAEKGNIQVTVIDERRSFPSTPKRAARQTGYYRIESEDIDPDDVPPLLFERLLSKVEYWGKKAIDELVIRHPDEIDPKLMSYLVWYLAFQYVRGEQHRRVLRDSIAGSYRRMYGFMTDEQIRSRLAEIEKPATDEAVAEIRRSVDALRSGSLIVQPQDAALIIVGAELADEIYKCLLDREWVIYQTPPVLVTCDEPVIAIGGPGHPRGKLAGLARAGVVIFPLSPNRLLAMFRKEIAPPFEPAMPVLDRIEVAEINREIVGNATRWVFERGGRRTAAAIAVPPYPSQHVKFDEIDMSSPDETSFRAHRSSRWANTDHPPPWPVAKWWEF